jgi:hypothetical protein
MTNADLLNRRAALQQAIQVVQTTKMKYAISKNLKRVIDELDPYTETLQTLLKEHEVQLTKAGGLPEETPDSFQREFEELLSTEAGPIEAYRISDRVFDKEDEKGSDIPFEVVAALDWMIHEE